MWSRTDLQRAQIQWGLPYMSQLWVTLSLNTAVAAIYTMFKLHKEILLVTN